jgi:outer membrane protein TolC
MNRALLALLFLLGSIDAVSGQAPLRLTLGEAVVRGLDASHRLAEWTAREEAARAIENQREAATLPQLSLLGAYARTNHVDEFTVPNAAGGSDVIFPDIHHNIRSRLDLQWPIYWGGRLTALTRAAAAEAEAIGRDHESARADLRLEVTRAFWAVITARASLNVLNQAVERTEAHRADVENQLSVGLVPPSDVLTIEAQLAHQRMLSIEAANLVETTSAEFRRLAGLDPDTTFELVADLNATPAPGAAGAITPSSVQGVPTAVLPSFRVAVDQAQANRAERKSLQLRISAASERIGAAAASSRPLLTAVGGYDVAMPNLRYFPIEERLRPSWDIGVNVRWPLFDGGRVRAETAEAIASRRAIEARLRDFDASVEVEVRQRIADVNSARASIDAAEAGVRAAAEARRVLAERFSAGVATNTDVLDAQVALLQAELDRTRALANLQLATALLDRALGR